MGHRKEERPLHAAIRRVVESLIHFHQGDLLLDRGLDVMFADLERLALAAVLELGDELSAAPILDDLGYGLAFDLDGLSRGRELFEAGAVADDDLSAIDGDDHLLTPLLGVGLGLLHQLDGEFRTERDRLAQRSLDPEALSGPGHVARDLAAVQPDERPNPVRPGDDFDFTATGNPDYSSIAKLFAYRTR